MPDVDDRLRQGRRALAELDPPADLWARAIDRAGTGDAELRHPPVAPTPRPPIRLLVAAAVAVVVALVGALVLRANDETVDTVPATEDGEGIGTVPVTEAPPVPAPATLVTGHGCPFGIAGDPIGMTPGPVDPQEYRFSPEPGQNIAHTVIGAHVAEVRVPGFRVGDVDRWRMEDARLARGTASVWLDGPPSGGDGKPFVQVRWLPATEEPCSSFTVTVDGGTEDENRQVAVDLADRIVLPGELGDPDLPGAEGGPVAGVELAGTEWRIVDPAAPDTARVSFTESTVTWFDGCATVSADYGLDRDDGALVLTNRTSSNPGCTPPTIPELRTQPWPLIDAVLAGGQIPVASLLDVDPFRGGRAVTGLLQLGEDDAEGANLVLAPA